MNKLKRFKKINKQHVKNYLSKVYNIYQTILF